MLKSSQLFKILLSLLPFLTLGKAHASTYYYEFDVVDTAVQYSAGENLEYQVQKSANGSDRILVEVDTIKGIVNYAAQFSGTGDASCRLLNCAPLSEEQLSKEVNGTITFGGTLFDLRDRQIESGGLWPPLYLVLDNFADIASIDPDFYRNNEEIRELAEQGGGVDYLEEKLEYLEIWQSAIPFDFKSLRDSPEQLFSPNFIDKNTPYYGRGLETAGVTYYLSYGPESFTDIFDKQFLTGVTGMSYELGNSQLSFQSNGFNSTIDNDFSISADGDLRYIGESPSRSEEITIEGSFALWNSFLGMVNILELVNESNTESLIQLKFFDLSGQELKTLSLALPAESQLDVVLNDIEGFTPDSYGMVQVVGNITGRLFYYRQTDSSPSFLAENDFAYAIELLKPITGTSFAGFNSFNPSFIPRDSLVPVWNWLTVLNLSKDTELYQVDRYKSSGILIDSRMVSIESFQRVDLSAAHDLSQQTVGTVKVTPLNPSAPYLSLLSRYSFNSNTQEFDFAFPLLARKAEGTESRTFLYNEAGAKNWLELSNTSTSQLSYQIRCYDAAGALIKDISSGDSFLFPSIPPLGQIHVPTSNLSFERSEPQLIVITASQADALLAQAVVYQYNGSGFASAFGFADIPDKETILSTSINTFQSIQNSMYISNFSQNSVEANLTLRSFGGFFSSQNLTIPAMSSLRIPVTTSEFPLESYGTAILSSAAPEALGAYILRKHTNLAQQKEDFAYPLIAQ